MKEKKPYDSVEGIDDDLLERLEKNRAAMLKIKKLVIASVSILLIISIVMLFLKDI